MIRITKEDIATYVPNTGKSALLHCKNAWLTNEEFYYGNGKWQISNMVLALVRDNGSLAIQFNDGVTKEFRLAIDNSTMASAAGLALFGGVGTIIAGNMALKNQIMSTSQQWAAAINLLISKRKPPEMTPVKENGQIVREKEIIREKEVIVKVRCSYCKNLYNETLDKCPHCGARL